MQLRSRLQTQVNFCGWKHTRLRDFACTISDSRARDVTLSILKSARILPKRSISSRQRLVDQRARLRENFTHAIEPNRRDFHHAVDHRFYRRLRNRQQIAEIVPRFIASRARTVIPSLVHVRYRDRICIRRRTP